MQNLGGPRPWCTVQPPKGPLGVGEYDWLSGIQPGCGVAQGETISMLEIRASPWTVSRLNQLYKRGWSRFMKDVCSFTANEEKNLFGKSHVMTSEKTWKWLHCLYCITMEHLKTGGIWVSSDQPPGGVVLWRLRLEDGHCVLNPDWLRYKGNCILEFILATSQKMH